MTSNFDLLVVSKIIMFNVKCNQCDRIVSNEELLHQNSERIRMSEELKARKKTLNARMFENTRVLIFKKNQLDTINEKLCEAKKNSSKLSPEDRHQLKEQLAINLNNLIAIPMNQTYFFSSTDESGLHRGYKYRGTVNEGCNRMHRFAEVSNVAEILASVRKEEIFKNDQFLENFCSLIRKVVDNNLTQESSTVIDVLERNSLCNCFSQPLFAHKSGRCLLPHDADKQCLKSAIESELRSLYLEQNTLQQQCQELDAAMIANLQHARNFYSNPPTCFCIQVGSFYPLWETAYNEKGFWKKQ